MSECYTVTYAPKAKEDLFDIYSYIAFSLSEPDTAEKQVNRIREQIRSLNLLPLRNPVVDWEPWKSLKVRRAVVDNFVFFYLVNSTDLVVTVIRIVYGKRNLRDLTAN